MSILTIVCDKWMNEISLIISIYKRKNFILLKKCKLDRCKLFLHVTFRAFGILSRGLVPRLVRRFFWWTIFWTGRVHRGFRRVHAHGTGVLLALLVVGGGLRQELCFQERIYHLGVWDFSLDLDLVRHRVRFDVHIQGPLVDRSLLLVKKFLLAFFHRALLVFRNLEARSEVYVSFSVSGAGNWLPDQG